MLHDYRILVSRRKTFISVEFRLRKREDEERRGSIRVFVGYSFCMVRALIRTVVAQAQTLQVENASCLAPQFHAALEEDFVHQRAERRIGVAVIGIGIRTGGQACGKVRVAQVASWDIVVRASAYRPWAHSASALINTISSARISR